MINFACRDTSAVKYSVVAVSVIRPGAEVWCAGYAESASVIVVVQPRLSWAYYVCLRLVRPWKSNRVICAVKGHCGEPAMNNNQVIQISYEQ